MPLRQYSFLRNISKALNKLGLEPILDGLYPPMCAGHTGTDAVKINLFMDQSLLAAANDPKRVPDWCIDQYLSHCFDLLGSGWVCVNRSLDESDKDTHDRYREIDWQRDYKSGYRFDREHTGRSIMRSDFPDGVDIKAPWELSRMYHLPKLAFAAFTSANRNALFTEYKNQVLDFLDNNPVGYGVNWTCAMEVGIRAANILLAYDLFAGAISMQWDAEFERSLIYAMLEHGRFILLNLEKAHGGKANGNHYLSDLCGLLFISSYITTKETTEWKQFAIDELLIEIDAQFFPDGGSAEGSTAYHRLSSELSTYSVALMLRNDVSIPQSIQNKLYHIAEFMHLITKADGDIIQIGDNDSGHLFRLTEAGVMLEQKIYQSRYPEHISKSFPYTQIYDADELWAGRVAEALFALFESTDAISIEVSVLKKLSHDKMLSAVQPPREERRWLPHTLTNVQCQYEQTRQFYLHTPIDTSMITHIVMDDFGLAIFSGEAGFQLFVRLPISGKQNLKSHLHDDVFHWECYHDGTVRFPDPGSYIYTGNKAEREQYRCNKAHNVPIHKMPFTQFFGMWDADITYKCYDIECSESGITLVVQTGETIHVRKIKILCDRISVEDKSNDPFVCNDSPNVTFSNGYGKKCIMKLE